MIIKKGVDITRLKDTVKEELERIETCCQLINGKKYQMTITSGNDGVHMENSKHYRNEAIDIRRRDMINAMKTAKIIKYVLGNNYDVILESDHIHIEYDPK